MTALLTPTAAAAVLGIHVKTLRGYIRRGELPVVRIGARARIAPADLDAFVAARRVPGVSPVAVAPPEPVWEIGTRLPKGARIG